MGAHPVAYKGGYEQAAHVILGDGLQRVSEVRQGRAVAHNPVKVHLAMITGVGLTDSTRDHRVKRSQDEVQPTVRAE